MFRRWRYRLEKGHPHLILLVGLLLLIIALSVTGGFLVYISGAGDSIGSSIWWTFLHISDPGYLGDDDTPRTAILGTIFTVLGMVTFMAGLVGILTSLITSALINLREGGAPIIFRDHIVIVGWNSRVFTLVADLVDANETHQIALLGTLDKADADQQLEKRIFSRIEISHGAKAARAARGQVVYRRGTPAVAHDLERVAAPFASRFILLSPTEGGLSSRAADVSQIRSLYSIERSHSEGERQAYRFNTVVELASDELRGHAFYSLRINPRRDAWVALYEKRLQQAGERSFLPVPRGEPSKNDLTAVNTGQIVSRIIAQCAIQPFLSTVYQELFSFRDKELLLWQPNQHWKPVWAEMVEMTATSRVFHLANRMQEGMVIGRLKDQQVSFDPADWDSIGNDVQYIVLGDRQQWSEDPQLLATPQLSADNVLLDPRNPESHVRVLILGINCHFALLVQQFTTYVRQYDNLDFALHVVLRPGEVAPECHVEDLEIRFSEADFTEWEQMGVLLESEDPFDSIVLLAEDVRLDDPEVDARVTLALVMLRAFREDANWYERLRDVNIVAEVRDPKNRNILQQVQMAGDVIVGDEFVSGFIAQVCIDHQLEEIYREILDYGDYEIYAHRLKAGGGAVTFGDLIAEVAAGGEIAIGFLRRGDDLQMLPVLAPPLDTPLQDTDLPLVIARE